MKLFFALLLACNVASAKPLSLSDLNLINTFLQTLMPEDVTAKVDNVDLDDNGLLTLASFSGSYKGSVDYDDTTYNADVKVSSTVLIDDTRVTLGVGLEGTAAEDLNVGNLPKVKEELEKFLGTLNAKGLYKGEVKVFGPFDGHYTVFAEVNPVTEDRRIENISLNITLPPEQTQLAKVELSAEFNTDAETANQLRSGLTGILNDLLKQKRPEDRHSETLAQAAMKLVTPLFEEAK